MVAAAVAANALGLAWLALAMDVHWAQVRGGTVPAPGGVRLLRVLGALTLAGALLLCLAVDHGSMASLVWTMSLAAAAIAIALTLSWRPRLLAPLVAWVPSARATP
ncbi:hypothetical protein ASF43_27920 [Pseudorhodoferax sp. Leaf267]|nr:hypothetical protein ASF43_27920 [Pseudorhodoferax sp. Leaf267]